MKLTTLDKAENIVIYDFSNLFYCCYHSARINTEEVNAGLFLLQTLRKSISQLKFLVNTSSSSVIFALDEFPQHKRDLCSDYKSNRKPLEVDFRPLLKSLFANTNCYFAKSEAQEADDVIATLVKKYNKKQIIVVSSDHDLLQLKKYSHVEIYNLVKNTFFTKEDFFNKYMLTGWGKMQKM